MQQTGKPPYDHSKRHGEAAPWDLVMQTRKGNVAGATVNSVASSGAATGASTSTAASRAATTGAAAVGAADGFAILAQAFP